MWQLTPRLWVIPSLGLSDRGDAEAAEPGLVAVRGESWNFVAQHVITGAAAEELLIAADEFAV